MCQHKQTQLQPSSAPVSQRDSCRSPQPWSRSRRRCLSEGLRGARGPSRRLLAAGAVRRSPARQGRGPVPATRGGSCGAFEPPLTRGGLLARALPSSALATLRQGASPFPGRGEEGGWQAAPNTPGCSPHSMAGSTPAPAWGRTGICAAPALPPLAAEPLLSLSEPKATGKGKRERAGTEAKAAVHHSPGSCSCLCSSPWGAHALFNTSWRGKGHSSLLWASPVPVPSFLRSDTQPWSRGCTLFSIPLLLLASSCAHPQVCLHPSSSLTSPVPRVFPGG